MSSISEHPQLTVRADDMEAIRELLHRYARAVDTSDEAMLAGCFADDIVLHRIDGPHEGSDTVLAFYRSVFEGPTLWSKHLITNIACTPTADGFAVQAYFQAVSRTADSAVMILGEYADEAIRDDTGSLRLSVKSIDVQQRFPLEVTTHG